VRGGRFPGSKLQHGDGLGERDGHVGVGSGLTGRLGGLPFQLDEPLGGGMRLCRRQPGQVIGERGIPAAGPAEPVSGSRVGLPVHRVVRPAFDDLPGCEAESLRSWSRPPAGRLPGLGGVDVVATDAAQGVRLGLGFPDVAQVVALGDGDDHGQTGWLISTRHPTAGPTMIIG